MSDKVDVAEGLDTGEWMSVGSTLFGARKVDAIDVEGDDAAGGRCELDLVHDDVLVSLVLDKLGGVSFDLESAGTVGEEGELNVGFGFEVEANRRLALGRDHEVGIAVSRAVVVSAAVVGLVGWLVVVARWLVVGLAIAVVVVSLDIFI
jgi:hypothetical protein